MAAELGLSPGAVSSILNGRGKQAGLPEKTVQRVLEHVARRGYVPSRHACRLRGAATRVIGILHVGPLGSHLVQAFQGIAGALSHDAQGVETCITSGERVEAAVRELVARRVTDLVWIHNNMQGGEQYRWGSIAQYLRNVRTILYNYPFDSPFGEGELLERGVYIVGVNRLEHTRKLARFLKKLGHRVIALPDVPRIEVVSRYFGMFTDEGLTVADLKPPFVGEEMKRVMEEQGVTAACFHGDGPAGLAIDDLRAMGIRIPEDLTVTGFDGISREYRRGLTTLVMPVEKMVAKVMHILAGTEQGQRHCFDLELVEGRTHGVPRGIDLSLAT